MVSNTQDGNLRFPQTRQLGIGVRVKETDTNQTAHT